MNNVRMRFLRSHSYFELPFSFSVPFARKTMSDRILRSYFYHSIVMIFWPVRANFLFFQNPIFVPLRTRSMQEWNVSIFHFLASRISSNTSQNNCYRCQHIYFTSSKSVTVVFSVCTTSSAWWFACWSASLLSFATTRIVFSGREQVTINTIECHKICH